MCAEVLKAPRDESNFKLAESFNNIWNTHQNIGADALPHRLQRLWVRLLWESSAQLQALLVAENADLSLDAVPDNILGGHADTSIFLINRSTELTRVEKTLVIAQLDSGLETTRFRHIPWHLSLRSGRSVSLKFCLGHES